MGVFNIFDNYMNSFYNQSDNKKPKSVEINSEIISEQTIEERPLTDEEFQELYSR